MYPGRQEERGKKMNIVRIVTVWSVAIILGGCATGGLVMGPFSAMAVTSNERAMGARRGSPNDSKMTGGEILKNGAGIVGDVLLYGAMAAALDEAAKDDGGSGIPSQSYSVSGNGNTVIIGNGAGVSVDNSRGE